MKRVYLIALSILSVLGLGANVSNEPSTAVWPIVQGGGGSTSAFTACATGTVRGFGYDTVTGLYQATCGNYNWSAENGGTVGGVADYTTATTDGGNSEYINCTGNGSGISDDGVLYDTTIPVATGTCSNTANTTTLKCAQSSLTLGIPANQFRDRIMVITSGATAGEARRIASDADVGLRHEYTLTADRPFSVEPDSETFEIYDDLGSVCWASGELVKINFMADAMLAQDHTAKSGRVYFPRFPGKASGIYVDRGCGRKGAGATAVSNACPVLSPPNDEHFQRIVQRVGQISWVLDGSDPDLAENGRTGVWFVDDFGSQDQPGDTNKGYDSNDGATTLLQHRFISGLLPFATRECHVKSAIDPTCVPADSSNPGIGDSGWSRLLHFVNTAAQTDPARFCVSSSAAVSGTCQGDRRLACETAGDAAADATGTAGCDYGEGRDFGPCESAADAMIYETEAQSQEIVLIADWLTVDFPEAVSSIGSHDAGWFRLHPSKGDFNTSHLACGTNGKWVGSGVYSDGTWAGWPIAQSALPADAVNQSFVVADTERWSAMGAYIDGGTFVPNNYYTRDIDGVLNWEINVTFVDVGATDTITAASGTPFSSLEAGDTIVVRGSLTNDGAYSVIGSTDTVISVAGLSSNSACTSSGNPYMCCSGSGTGTCDEAAIAARVQASAIGDCLSGNDTSESNDEPSCDTADNVGSFSGFGGGFRNNVIGYGSAEFGSAVDGTINAFKAEYKDMIVKGGRRGLCADISDWSMDRILWADNQSPGNTCVNSNFTHSSRMTNQWFQGNSADTILGLNPGRGSIYRDLFFESNDSVHGQILLNGGTGILFDSMVFSGNSGNAVGIRFDNPIGNVTFRNLTGISGPNVGDAFNTADAFVVIGRGGNAAFNKEAQSISFDGIKTLTSTSNTCLFYFDDEVAGDSDDQINLNRTQFSIRDGSIVDVNGATGTKAICVTEIGALGTPSASAADDTGILAEQYQPSWSNVRVNGVPIPDSPMPSMTGTAINALGNCGDAGNPIGTVVRTSTDITAIGTCDGTTTLNTTGDFQSVCKCAAGPQWDPL